MPTHVVLIGNGLPAGFDPELATPAITARVEARLEPAELATLREIEPLLTAEGPVPTKPATSFESLAGPIDRVASALIALQGLLATAPDSELLRSLDDASLALRQLYFRLVGLVLDDIDSRCTAPDAVDDDRRAAWASMNEFVASLLEVPGPSGTQTLFTVNYDSLLDSALLQVEGRLYDGFPGLRLVSRLEPPTGMPALYHLHGSVAWTNNGEEVVRKRRLDYLRAVGLLDQWIRREFSDELPTVVLSDLKTVSTGRYPFTLFYDELRRQLRQADRVIAVGLGFGDQPLNALLAQFLTSRSDRQLHAWTRTGRPGEYYASRLRAFPDGDRLMAEQIVVTAAKLPDASLVAGL